MARLLSWKLLGAVLLIVSLLGGIKYRFDTIEKNQDR
jgi:hypothetical protein